MKGRDNLSGTLDSVASSADDVADNMREAASAAETFSGGLSRVEENAEDAEDEVSSLERSVNSLNRSFESGILAAGGYASALEAIDDADIDVDTFDSGRMPTAPQSASRASDGLPQEGRVDVEADVDRSSFVTARAMAESIPDRKTVEVDTDTDTSELSSLWSSLDSVENLLSRIGDIDLGEKLLPDRDGRDGSIMPDLPDTEGLEMVDRPPPKLTIPAEIRPSRIDLSEHIPDSVATRLEFDRDRVPDIRELVPDSVATRVEFDYDRRSLTRLRDRVSESIRVPLQFVRGSTPDAPSFGGGGDDDAFDVHLGSVIPDMPDIDVPDGLGKLIPSLEGISKSGSDAADTLSGVGSGVMSVLGLTEQAAGLSRIAGALGKIGGSGGAVSVLGGIGGALIAWGAIGTILGAITSLVAAIGGLVTAIAGLGAATAGLLGMGLLKRGEQFAETSEDIEGTMEGIQAYAKSLKPAVEKAIAPLRSLPTGDFLDGFVQGGLGVLSDFSRMTKRLFPSIQGMFDRLGEAWSANQPEFFAELEKTIADFLPLVESFITRIIRAAPQAISLMRKMGTKFLPKIGDMFGAIWGNIKPFIPAGAALASILIDLTTIFFELMKPISQLMGAAIGPGLQAIAFGMEKLKEAVQFVIDPISNLIAKVKDWIDALWSAIFNLEPGRFGAIAKNAVLGVLQKITQGLKMGINALYKTVLSMIKNMPGASQAIGAMNTASKALGQGKAVPNSLLGGKKGLQKGGGGMFQGMMTDLQPNKPGLQTAPGQGPAGRASGAPMGPYSGNNTEVNVNNYQDVMGTSRSMSQRVKKAMEQQRRYDRKARGPTN